MARCEDFPCCGHEAGCCPDFDAGGQQLNMRCTCGAIVPLSSPYSLCNYCLDIDDNEALYEARHIGQSEQASLYREELAEHEYDEPADWFDSDNDDPYDTDSYGDC